MVALQNLQKEGGKMKKEKQVSIRLTEEEYNFIQSCLGKGESSVTGFIYHAIQYYIESIGKQIFITAKPIEQKENPFKSHSIRKIST